VLALAAPQVLEGVRPLIVVELVLMPTMAHPKPIGLLVTSSAKVWILCSSFNEL
jgi:hypothetical protein